MAGFGVVFRKEFVDSLRERRSVVSALVFGPLLGPILFVLLANYAVNLQIDESEQPIEVPVVGGEGAGNLMAHLFRRQIDVVHDRFADIDSLRDAVRSGDVEVGLVVDAEFGEALRTGEPARLWIVADMANNTARRSITRLRLALGEYNAGIGSHRLVLRGITPDLAVPVAVLTDDVSTPSGRAVLLLGMMTYFLLFSTLLGGTQVAIDTTAGERERGSLEPLLALAVSRSEMVWGKLGVTFVFMAVSLATCVVSFAIAVQFLPLAKNRHDREPQPVGVCWNLRLDVAVRGPRRWANDHCRVLHQVLPGSADLHQHRHGRAAATDHSRGPQPGATVRPLMLVPSLSQHLLVTELVKGEALDPLHMVVSAATTMAFAVACAFATVRRYRSEALLV